MSDPIATDLSIPLDERRPRRVASPRQPVHRPPGASPGATLRARLAGYASRAFLTLAPITFGLLVGSALLAGWLYREEEHVTPKTGLGYWLGITGSLIMLLLVLYPLRKRWKWMARLGRVPGWFRLHMVMGIIGPALILLHSNFRLASINGSVALAAMLTVVLSGLAGRYLYSSVHVGLYGRRAEIEQMLADSEQLTRELGRLTRGDKAIRAELDRLRDLALSVPKGVLQGAGRLIAIASTAAATRRRMRRLVRIALNEDARRLRLPRRQRRLRSTEADDFLRTYCKVIGKIARLALFERLLALWHVLHLPLFVLLVLAAMLHILAVHLY